MSGPFVLLYCIVSGLKFRSLPKHYVTKVGCILQMTVVSILPQPEFGQNDHREDAAHFRLCKHNVSVTIRVYVTKF